MSTEEVIKLFNSYNERINLVSDHWERLDLIEKLSDTRTLYFELTGENLDS